MGKAYRLVQPKLTARDVVDFKNDPDYRLTTSPFGLTPEEYSNNPPIYVGRAVSWKGKGGAGMDNFERFMMNESGLADPQARALVNGLKKAVSISKACAGVKGTVIWNGKLYPKKCIEQKRRAGKA